MAAQTGVAGPEGDTVKARMQVREATTDEERERIFRFRYEGYWEQQRLLPELCDHERKTLRDADDAVARLFYVERAGTVLGTLRVNWFADGPASAANRDLFGVAPFERSLGTEQMALLSRFIVAPEERGGACAGLLLLEVARFGIAKRIHLAFCDCEPHLMPFYRSIGFRSYKSVVGHATSGVLIPLILVVSDRAYLDRIGSYLCSLLPDEYPSCPDDVLALISDGGAQSVGADVDEDQALTEYRRAADGRHTLFEGLSDEEVKSLLAKALVIECAAGDALARSDHASKPLYAVLDGVVEVHRDGQLVSIVGPGELTGEFAFLLGRARTADLVAATNVRVLALSDRTLDRVMLTSPSVASTLMRNLTATLAERLIRQSARPSGSNAQV